VPRIAPNSIVQGLKDYKITTILAVPQLAILFMQRIEQTASQTGQLKSFQTAQKIAIHLPILARRLLFKKVIKQLGGSLSVMATGGAPIPPDIARKWELMGIKMVQGYGLTETSPILTMNNLKERRFDSQGSVIPTTKLRIAKDGEIEAHGDNIFKEYWQNEEATKAAFTSDGWFKTGDVGVLRNNWLYIQGRAKFAIVLSSGLKVFPEDVEQWAEKQELLQMICVVGVKTDDGEAVKMVIISSSSDKAIEEAVRRTNSQLQSFQHISSWVRWPETEFPRTRLLKIDRKSVQAWANDNSSLTAGAEVSNDSSDKLISFIRLILKKPDQPIKDSDVLAEIGLDSLRRLTLVSMIEDRLGISVPEASITQTTTINKLRQLVGRGSSAEKVDNNRPSWPFNPVVRLIGNLFRNLFFRAIVNFWIKSEVSGLDNLKNLNGPTIFMFNHLDGADVPVLYQVLPRPISNRLAIAFGEDMMQKLGPVTPISRFAYASYAFARTQPYAPSLEYTGRLVDKGWNIAIAPEGQLSHSEKLQPFKSGIGLLAVELGIPVVAVRTNGLIGTAPLSKMRPVKHSKITVAISKPITFDKHTNYDDATDQLHKLMSDLQS
jgi:long-chain acyl-CoA synthetase